MSATTTMLRTEARLFRREPGALFWILVFPAGLLAILGAIPSFREVQDDGTRIVTFYVPIVVLTAMVMASVQMMPSTLATYRERGILRRIGTTPARPLDLLLAQFVVYITAIVVASLLAIALGRLAYDVSLPKQPFGYLLAYVLAAASALSIGLLIASLAPNGKIAQALGGVVFFPMMFTAGLWLPVSAMPDGLRRVVECLPMGAAARALDQATAGSWPDAKYLLVVLAWTLLCGGIAARTFRWE